MRYLAILAVLLLLSSCAYQNYKWLRVDGKEIKTPYGKADADMYYESRMCFPKCFENLTNQTQTGGDDDQKVNAVGNSVIGN